MARTAELVGTVKLGDPALGTAEFSMPINPSFATVTAENRRSLTLAAGAAAFPIEKGDFTTLSFFWFRASTGVTLDVNDGTASCAFTATTGMVIRGVFTNVDIDNSGGSEDVFVEWLLAGTKA